MFILSFCYISNHEQLNESINVRDFDGVDALIWIRKSNIAPTGRVVHHISKKAEERKKVVDKSTI